MSGNRTLDRATFNISAYRVLYILLLLVQHRSLSLSLLNQFFMENPLISRAYNSETITKYINTLRKLDCRIPKAGNANNFSYELLKHPFPLVLTDAEVKAAQQLLYLLASQPDEELHIRYYQFLQTVAWAISDEAQETMLFDIEQLFLSPSLQKKRQLLAFYKKLCREALVLEINYHRDENDIARFILEPNRVLMDGRGIFLLGVNTLNYQMVKLNLEKIVSCKQLPFKSQNRLKEITVVFELKNRMARTYRLYPGETIVMQSPEALQVKIKTDDDSSLIRRLAKYGDQCEIIAPQSMREQMVRLIDSYLSIM